MFCLYWALVCLESVCFKLLYIILNTILTRVCVHLCGHTWACVRGRERKLFLDQILCLMFHAHVDGKIFTKCVFSYIPSYLLVIQQPLIMDTVFSATNSVTYVLTNALKMTHFCNEEQGFLWYLLLDQPHSWDRVRQGFEWKTFFFRSAEKSQHSDSKKQLEEWGEKFSEVTYKHFTCNKRKESGWEWVKS